MKWYWKVRLHSPNEQYAFAEITTNRDLAEINAIQEAYQELTGCQMLLEEMGKQSFKQENGFHVIWRQK